MATTTNNTSRSTSSSTPIDSHTASLEGQTENQPVDGQHQAQRQLESSNPSPPPSPPQPRHSSSPEFDPFANAKIASPFYLYNHDSPGDRSDSKTRVAPGGCSGSGSSVTVKDLEAQQMDEDLTPTVTDTTLEKRCSLESTKPRLWARRSRQAQCLTKKRVSRWKSLPAWQRLTIKLLIGLLLTGMVVGVAVGVTLRVNGGVYKNSNQSTNIH